jgi:hypothetical protein
MIEESGATREADCGQPRLSRRWLICLAQLLAAAGLLLLVIGSVMPAYTDPVAAERIREGLECELGIPNTNSNQRCDSELWYRSMNTLRTSKWSLFDGGAGLVASGLTLGAFFWWSRRKPWRDVSTPKSSLSILALAGLSWLAQIYAYELYFLTEFVRGYDPHWADSITIPIFQFRRVLLRLFFPYMVVWLILLVGARLPAPVFSTIPGRPLVNAFWTGATALLLVPVGWVLIGAILEGPIVMVPFLWLTLWLTLCARAAALTRHRPGQARRAKELAPHC